MCQLGLEFLDGKFNYREGHSVKVTLLFDSYHHWFICLVCYVVSKESLAFDHRKNQM